MEVEAQKILGERQKKLDAAIEVIFERELAKVPEELRERVKTARNTKDPDRTPEQIALLKDFPSADPKPSQIDLYDPAATAELKKDDERAAEVRKQKPVEDFLVVFGCDSRSLVGDLDDRDAIAQGALDQTWVQNELSPQLALNRLNIWSRFREVLPRLEGKGRLPPCRF